MRVDKIWLDIQFASAEKNQKCRSTTKMWSVVDENLVVVSRQNEAIWSPTCWNRRLIICQLLSNCSKLVRFKKFLGQMVIIFLERNQLHRIFRESSSAGLSKLHSACPQDLFWDFVLKKKWKFVIFSRHWAIVFLQGCHVSGRSFGDFKRAWIFSPQFGKLGRTKSTGWRWGNKYPIVIHFDGNYQTENE